MVLGSATAPWVARDRRFRLQAGSTDEVVLDRGQGLSVWDVEGRHYLDFESGQFGLPVGHAHPEVIAAATEQLGRLMHHSVRFLNVPRIQLAERLAQIAPGRLQHSYFGCSGAEASEVALNLAKTATGRFEVVTVLRNYHGRTSGAASASTSFWRERGRSGPPLPGFTTVPAPYPYRCPFGACRTQSCDLTCWEYGLEYVERTTSGQPAAVILELVIGAGGAIPVPKAWAQAVRRFCDERGALLIVDESLTGVGRTGTWFACEQYDLAPDILTTAKGFGGGLPVCAVVTTSEVAEQAIARGFVQSPSHMGDPIQCAVALATLDVIERHGLLANARARGEQLLAGCRALQARHECLGEVRGLGLLLGLEIVSDRERRTPAGPIAAKITAACQRRGLLVGGTRSSTQNVIRLAPPLIVSEEQIRQALSVLDEAIGEASQVGA